MFFAYPKVQESLLKKKNKKEGVSTTSQVKRTQCRNSVNFLSLFFDKKISESNVITKEVDDFTEHFIGESEFLAFHTVTYYKHCHIIAWP